MKLHKIHYGKKFYPRHDGYWVCTNKAALHAHRWVWMKHNGPIPKGCHIHHIDGNPGNNSIENLQLLEAGNHTRLHTSTPEAREKARKLCYQMHPKLLAWNKTKEGKEFRKKEGAKIYANTPPIMILCKECGKDHITKTHHTAFCSKICKWKHARKLSKIEKTCVHCSKTFISAKAKKARFCSPSCSAIVQWQNKA